MHSARYHLIFDLTNCHEEVIADKKKLKDFIVETISSIDMKIIAGPFIEEGIPENPGLSGLAILDFSHVSVHTFTKYREVMIDVFSCKPFDKQKLRHQCVTYFATPETIVRAKEVWWEKERKS